MKKTIGMALACGLVFLMAGCGREDKLVCELKQDEGKLIYETVFDGDKVKSAKAIMELKDKAEAKEAYEYYKEGNNDKNLKLDGKKIISVATKEQIELTYSEFKNKAEVKKSMEKSGYTCK